jgi:hypothetical protein
MDEWKRLRDYINKTGSQLDFDLGASAVAVIVGGGVIVKHWKLIKDISFTSEGNDSGISLALEPTEDPGQNSPVHLFPLLGSAIRVLLDDGDVLRAGTTPMSAVGNQPANRRDDAALYIAATELQEAIDRGITGVTGSVAVIDGVFQSKVTEDCIIEITVSAKSFHTRLAEMLVEMSDVLEKRTGVIYG